MMNATVPDEVKLLCDLHLEGGQAFQVFEQMKGSVAIDRDIRKTRRSVTSDSAAAEAFYAKRDTLGEIPARARTQATRFFRRTESVGYRSHAGRCAAARLCSEHLSAREYADGEAVNEPKDFIVAEARIEGNLRNDIGRRIEGVICGGVVAVAGARFAEQVVGRVAMCGERGLRVLNGECNGNLVAEALGEADAVLAGGEESDSIIGNSGVFGGWAGQGEADGLRG